MDSTVNIFTDGSKNETGVCSGIAIFLGKKLTQQLKFKLSSRCTNNQAEQLAIVKALDTIAGGVPQAIDKPKTATIYTDSSITIDSLKNPRNHRSLIHMIREKVTALEEKNWKIHLTWVNAHVGLYGKEMADKLAKEAATGVLR